MAEKKYAKYFTKVPQGEFNDMAFEGKISLVGTPTTYDGTISKLAPIFCGVMQIYAPDGGFGLNNLAGMPGEEPRRELPHKHNADEIFILHGTNPDNPAELGGEVEFWMGEGKDAEKYTITEPTVVLVPAGVIHCPIWIKKVDRPFFCTVVMLSPDYASESTEVYPPDFVGPSWFKRPRLQEN